MTDLKFLATILIPGTTLITNGSSFPLPRLFRATRLFGKQECVFLICYFAVAIVCDAILTLDLIFHLIFRYKNNAVVTCMKVLFPKMVKNVPSLYGFVWFCLFPVFFVFFSLILLFFENVLLLPLFPRVNSSVVRFDDKTSKVFLLQIPSLFKKTLHNL